MDAIAGPTVVASNHAHDTTDIGAIYKERTLTIIAVSPVALLATFIVVVIFISTVVSIKVVNHVIMTDNLVFIDIVTKVITRIVKIGIVSRNSGQVYITCALGICHSRKSVKDIGIYPLTTGRIGPVSRRCVIYVEVGKVLAIFGPILGHIPAGVPVSR